MQALSSSVLLLMQRPSSDLSIGVDYSSSLDGLSLDYDVIAISLQDALSESFRTRFETLKARNPWTQLVLLAPEKTPVNILRDAAQYYAAARVALSVEDKNLEAFLAEALEKAQQIKQNQDLEKLVQEQNERLKSLYNALEERVHKRQQFLEESKRKTLLASARWETIRQASMIIHQSASIPEMEQALTLLLSDTVHIDVLRILFHPNDKIFIEQNSKSDQWKSYRALLYPPLGQRESLGSVLFLKEGKQAFSKEEGEFLTKVAEVISLALDRLKKLEESKGFKDQWEATFNAVSEPVMMVKPNYDIVQTNSAFLSIANATSAESLGRKCYQVLFDRDQPCAGCRMGSTFRIENKRNQGRTHEVTSQAVRMEPFPDRLFFHQYADITDQLKIERKLVESTKLAELGTIGSSIAHELNNPLGGLLSFTQLIKMDLKPGDPIYEDICALESGAKRCRDIVQNLLGFSRNPLDEDERHIDLRDAIDRALRIAELQTKSVGIEVKLNLPETPIMVHGHLNLLAQALQHILQTIIQGFQNQTEGSQHRLIELRISEEKSGPAISILDNSPGLEMGSSLGFSVAQQIVHEHGGSLEVTRTPRQLRQIKMSLPRPD